MAQRKPSDTEDHWIALKADNQSTRLNNCVTIDTTSQDRYQQQMTALLPLDLPDFAKQLWMADLFPVESVMHPTKKVAKVSMLIFSFRWQVKRAIVKPCRIHEPPLSWYQHFLKTSIRFIQSITKYKCNYMQPLFINATLPLTALDGNLHLQLQNPPTKWQPISSFSSKQTCSKINLFLWSCIPSCGGYYRPMFILSFFIVYDMEAVWFLGD